VSCADYHYFQISIENKSRFGYQGGYAGRLIGVLICWVTSETGTQVTIFDWLVPMHKSVKISLGTQ